MHAPPSGTDMDLQGCPTSSLASLLPCPPPALPLTCAQLQGAAGARMAPLAGGCTAEQALHEITKQPGTSQPIYSPFLPLESFTHFTPVRLPLLLISQLLVRSPSLSFSWAVTSTSMKYSCLCKGEILESHFFQSTAAETSLFYLWSPWTHLFLTPCCASHRLFLK